MFQLSFSIYTGLVILRYLPISVRGVVWRTSQLPKPYYLRVSLFTGGSREQSRAQTQHQKIDVKDIKAGKLSFHPYCNQLVMAKSVSVHHREADSFVVYCMRPWTLG